MQWQRGAFDLTREAKLLQCRHVTMAQPMYLTVIVIHAQYREQRSTTLIELPQSLHCIDELHA